MQCQPTINSGTECLPFYVNEISMKSFSILVIFVALLSSGFTVKPNSNSTIFKSIYSDTAAMLAQQQLDAYNKHDLEAFLLPYAEDVEIYMFPDKLQLKGKAEMRKAYEFITKTPKLNCKLLNRIVQGNTVIDHEEVYGFGDKPVYAIAIYKIEKGKIAKVYFIQ